MILTWNSDDIAQLYEGIGKSAWNWSGPAGATVALVTGPVCWAAGMAYHPGFMQGEAYKPGFMEGEVYHPGFVAGQRDCEHDG